MKQPSLKTWGTLYELALRFRDSAPWEWMFDSDLFGVEDPKSGQIGYCCVMGNLGEFFALAVYLGSEGLQSYLTIATEEAREMDPLGVQTLQRCLMVSFEDRGDLREADRRLIKQLGLKVRGHKAWPLFRSYMPGYLPWFLSADEARFLAVVLPQALDVVLRYQDDPELLEPTDSFGGEPLFLVRVAEKKGKRRVWQDTWMAPEPLQATWTETSPPDEVTVRRLQNKVQRQSGIWEMDFFYLPTPVDEGERPYFPYTVLYVDHHSGMILGTELMQPWSYSTDLPDTFLNLVEGTAWLPLELRVRNEESARLIGPAASRLGVTVNMVEELEMLDMARESLFSFLGG